MRRRKGNIDHHNVKRGKMRRYGERYEVAIVVNMVMEHGAPCCHGPRGYQNGAPLWWVNTGMGHFVTQLVMRWGKLDLRTRE